MGIQLNHSASVACVLGLLMLCLSSNAQTINWTNASGGAYSVGTNWSNGTGVGAGSTSLFGLAGSYTVTFLSSASAVNSNISAGTVSFLGGPSRSYLLSGGLFLNGGTLNTSSLNVAATGSFSINTGSLNATTSSNLSSATLLLGNGGSAFVNLNGGTTTSYRALSAAGTSIVGNSGGLGTFTISNTSTATFDGQLTIASGTLAGTRGVVRVDNNATLTLNSHLAITPATGGGQGTLSVFGTVNRTGTGTIAIGGTGAGSAYLYVDPSGAFAGGSGAVQINPNGTLTNLGTFATSGDVLVNGGTLNQPVMVYDNAVATIGGTLTLDNGGTIALNAGTLSVHSLQINNGFLDMTNGASANRTLIINGGTLARTDGGAISFGATTNSTATAGLQFINGATRTGQLFWDNAADGELSILSGAVVNTDLGVLNYGSGHRLSVLVSGAGSMLNIGSVTFNTQRSDLSFDVQGGGQINLAQRAFLRETSVKINIKPAGTFTIADAGTLSSNDTVNLAGGTLSILSPAALDPQTSGTVNFTAGTLRVRSATNVDADFTNFALGAPSILSFGKALQIDGTGTFSVPVQLNGGTLTLTGIAGGANLTLTSGTFNLNNPLTFSIGSGGPFGSNITVPAGLTFNVSGNSSANTIAQLIVNGGTFNNGGTYTNNGEIQLLNGGRFSSGTLNNTGNGTITGNGRIVTRLSNSGLIRSGPADFLRFQGLSNINSGTVNLLGGVVEFTSGLTNNTGATIVGRGSLLVPGNLDNNGTLTFTGGPAELQGRLNNNATAKVTVTGGSTASFYDLVTNSAGSVFKVSDASVAVFLGDVQGLAAFTGAGTIIFEGTTTPGPLVASGTAIVQSTATVQAESLRDNTLIVRGPTEIVPNGTSAATSRLSSLVIEDKGLNLNDNDLVIDYSGVSPIATIRGYLNDHLLYSDLADSSTTPKFALGYRENSDGLSTFSGQNVDGTSLLIAYTFAGDSNLDGKVNTIDFNQLAGAFGQANQFWFNGDYDYNGSVNSVDFNLLAGNFGRSMPLNAPSVGAMVPEPACGCILAGMVLLGSKRRW